MAFEESPFEDGEMVATYNVTIDVNRTRAALAALDREVQLLRTTKYSETTNATIQSNTGNPDFFVTKLDDMAGKIQGKVEGIMGKGMTQGKNLQKATLIAATTDFGEKRMAGKGGKSRGKGPGRNRTGQMIAQIGTNVEVLRTDTTTVVTGWHGWKQQRPAYFDAQENGSRGSHAGSRKTTSTASKRKNAKARVTTGNGGVPAADSLGSAIVPVREKLKADLKGMGITK